MGGVRHPCWQRLDEVKSPSPTKICCPLYSMMIVKLNSFLMMDNLGETKTTTYKFFTVEILRTFKQNSSRLMTLDNWAYLQTRQFQKSRIIDKVNSQKIRWVTAAPNPPYLWHYSWRDRIFALFETPCRDRKTTPTHHKRYASQGCNCPQPLNPTQTQGI